MTVKLMGIVNVTPDSFSDGGQFFSPDAALKHIESLVKEGADYVDLGAESTRPGAAPLALEEECKRLEPILKQYKNITNAPLSIDTTKAQVAEIALHYGADIINDVSGGTRDPNMMATVAKSEKGFVIMHSQGTPETMQDNPSYPDVVKDVVNFLDIQCQRANEHGITNIIIDPGIGFGKTAEHNCQLLQNLHQLKRLGHPILVGASNKSFIGAITQANVQDRLPGTLTSHLIAIQNGASIIRAHDIAAHQQMRQLLTKLS